MDFSATYNKLNEIFINVIYYYKQIYNSKFVFYEYVRFDKLNFIYENILQSTSKEIFSEDLERLNNMMISITSSICDMPNLYQTTSSIHNILEFLISEIQSEIDNIMYMGFPIDDVSMYVKMTKTQENRHKLVGLYRTMGACRESIGLFLKNLRKLKISEIKDFVEHIKTFDFDEYVKNDMYLYSKCKDIINNTPFVKDDDYYSVNEFFIYYEIHIIKLENDVNDKKKTLEYYTGRKDKTIEMCKTIKNDLFEITYEYDYMMKNVLSEYEIKEIKSYFT